MRAPINTLRLRHALRCQHHHLPFSASLAEEDDPFVSASKVLDEWSCKLCGVLLAQTVIQRQRGFGSNEITSGLTAL